MSICTLRFKLRLKPPQFFHYAGQHTLWCKKWDTICTMGKVWTSKKDDMIFYEISCQKGSQQTTMIKHTWGWDTLHPLFCFNPKTTNLSCHIPPLHLSGIQMLVRGCSSRTSPSIWLQSINQSMKKLSKHLMLNHRLSNLISSGKSYSNNVNRPLRIG